MNPLQVYEANYGNSHSAAVNAVWNDGYNEGVRITTEALAKPSPLATTPADTLKSPDASVTPQDVAQEGIPQS